MSIEVVTYYRAVCDVCGIDYTANIGEHSAWSDDNTPAEEVVDGGGIVLDHWLTAEDRAARPDAKAFVVCHECLLPYKRALSDEEWDDLHDEQPEATAKMRDHFAALSKGGGHVG